MSKLNLGAVTAYADAVAQGYKGTREQFGKEQAEFAANAAKVAAAKEAAALSEKNAAASEATAKTSAANAAVSEQAAKASESNSAASALGAAVSETNAKASETAAQEARTAAEAAQEAAEEAQEAAEEAAAETKDTAAGVEAIVAGNEAWTKLESDLRYAPPVVETASGEVIVLDDASERVLQGLKLYGKSVQDGVPTPDAPIDIVSVGGDGVTEVCVAGRNLWADYITDYSYANGSTVKANPDGSITVHKVAGDVISIKHDLYLPAGVYTIADYAAERTDIYIQATLSSALTTKSAAVKFGTYTGGQAEIVLYSNASVDADITLYPMLLYGEYTAATIPPYEPYKPIQTLPISTPNGLPGIPVTSGGNYTDADGQMWVCDEVDFARGVRVQRVKKFVLDGTETWEKAEGYSVFMVGSVNNPALGLTGIGGIHTYAKPMSNYYTGTHETSSANMGNKTCTQYRGVGGEILKFKYESIATLEDWRTYLIGLNESGNPLTAFCIINTSIETPLTEAELAAYRALHTNKPNTTIYADDNAGISVDYAADTKLYIDKKFAELSAAIINN